MQDPEKISETLEAASNGATAKTRGRQLQCFRGVRGVPLAKLTEILVAEWKTSPANLPDDEDWLRTLFMSAFEDGIVAIGLLSAAIPDAPADALDIAEELLTFVDDTESADALGWLVLGPGLLATGEPLEETLLRYKDKPVHRRRAAMMALMAALPVSVEGPAAAAIRERMGTRQVAFVETPQSEAIEAVVRGMMRDEAPAVRKALCRVMRSWATVEPDRVEALINGFPGGIPKLVREEATRGIRKARRPPRRQRSPNTDLIGPFTDEEMV
jgi:hypothetical protein